MHSGPARQLQSSAPLDPRGRGGAAAHRPGLAGGGVTLPHPKKNGRPRQAKWKPGWPGTKLEEQFGEEKCSRPTTIAATTKGGGPAVLWQRCRETRNEMGARLPEMAPCALFCFCGGRELGRKKGLRPALRPMQEVTCQCRGKISAETVSWVVKGKGRQAAGRTQRRRLLNLVWPSDAWMGLWLSPSESEPAHAVMLFMLFMLAGECGAALRRLASQRISFMHFSPRNHGQTSLNKPAPAQQPSKPRGCPPSTKGYVINRYQTVPQRQSFSVRQGRERSCLRSCQQVRRLPSRPPHGQASLLGGNVVRGLLDGACSSSTNMYHHQYHDSTINQCHSSTMIVPTVSTIAVATAAAKRGASPLLSSGSWLAPTGTKRQAGRLGEPP